MINLSFFRVTGGKNTNNKTKGFTCHVKLLSCVKTSRNGFYKISKIIASTISNVNTRNTLVNVLYILRNIAKQVIRPGKMKTSTLPSLVSQTLQHASQTWDSKRMHCLQFV